jgi:pimeloyl-ACP methyl ester carboxylesterase
MPKFTTSDGLSLHYSDHGSGLPILCLAGLTRTGADFDYVAPSLSEHRVIRLDYRGRGQSDWDDNWQNYTIPVESRDVIELMDHLGLEAAAIIGTSRGGLIAMGLAAYVPHRILGVVLNDIGPELAPKGLDGVMTYLARRPTATTFEGAAQALEQGLVGFANVPKSRWMQEAQKLYVKVDDGLNFTYDPKLRDAVEMPSEKPDLWPFFDALANTPLCCIRGANSDLLTAQTLNKMQERRPDMIATTVPDRAHIPFLDEPHSIEAIQMWLEKIK